LYDDIYNRFRLGVEEDAGGQIKEERSVLEADSNVNTIECAAEI